MTFPPRDPWFRARPAALLLAVTLAAGACGSTTPAVSPSAAGSEASPSGTASGAPSSQVAHGPRPVVVDTDLATDDILAIMVLLRDPGVDVRGIAVDGTGEVRCPAGLRNARRLVAAFGRGDIPVACGRENPGASGRWFPSEWRDGADAFYGVQLPAVDGEADRTGEQAPALLARLAAATKAEATPLTVVALGPWTNLADAVAADPAFATNVAGIHAMGGTLDAPGNIDIETTSPADKVEWNFGADPDALAAVMATDIPVTMVGLDATNAVPVPHDIAETLGKDTAAAGADIAHELYLRNPYLAQGSSFWDTLATVLLTDASIASWEDATVRIETHGRSAGRTVRDPDGRPVHAATTADRDAFMTAFLAGLRRGPARPGESAITGSLTATWDGTSCEPSVFPSTAGDVVLTFDNRAPDPAALALARVTGSHTWAEALAWVASAHFDDPKLALPDWIIPIETAPSADGKGSATSVVTLEAGTYGIACQWGSWPKVRFTDAGTFEVKG